MEASLKVNTFREGTLYVSKKTLRRLKWVREAEGAALYRTDPETGQTRTITLDELADKILNQFLTTNYPGLVPAEKLLEQAEDQVIQTVKDTK